MDKHFKGFHLPPSVQIDSTQACIVESSDTPNAPETKDIFFPNHQNEISHAAVDIGGSLAKVVYFTREEGGGGRLNFSKFETAHIEECITFLASIIENRRRSKQKSSSDITIMATGGGAFKFYDRIKKEIGVEIIREEEMECLIVGLDFFITQIPGEVFTYSDEDGLNLVTRRTPAIYPYLLGGGTLWGLLSALTPAKSFDEMLEMSESGNNTTVDMLVGDIYGTDYEKIGLKSTTIASTFGKAFRKYQERKLTGEDKDDNTPLFQPEDLCRSLLYAISNNIGQIAYLQAQNHNLEHIYFGGSFIRGHIVPMNTLSYAIKFWSKGTKQAYFLRHEGYLGAIGAFLKHQPTNWGRSNGFSTEDASLERQEFTQVNGCR
ncbi:Pantothenate kinase [Neolecta irregularis DAH-3]|uniref:Pantothenate kinase n=1 Tax=Neolecta irregularis (strain DAH-3) TaxID=1198029 RepID=A0A1U7LJG1_NEOID|nr:Pantothenate kinase [Neolecta irregularis DAH-3]|eukprot:OLL22661.1 Pantothenate kinase [Neolecta irregularis DAH-3]